MTRAIIAAAGTRRRYLGVRKQELIVDGETLLGRTIRLLRENGVEDIIIAGPFPGYGVPTREPRGDPEEVDGRLAVRHLWSATGRTIILMGDTYYTDAAMRTIIGHAERDQHLFARFGPSWYTGKDRPEIFANSFWPEHRAAHAASLRRVLAMQKRGETAQAGLWEAYLVDHGRTITGPVPEWSDRPYLDEHHRVEPAGDATEIDDWTEDFDYPADYERFMARHTGFARRLQWEQLAAGNGRHWWARRPGNGYVPPAFALLSEDEWTLMMEWWAATNDAPGEVNVPGLGILQGLIEGGGIRHVVELGRYEGYSTLLLGFMLRRMGARRGLISFDIAPGVTERARTWVTRAGLDLFVRLELSDSRNPVAVRRARRYLGAAPELIFLDTSHARDQTAVELPLWYEALAPGGLLILHDSSVFAERWDGLGAGGVRAGVRDWLDSLANPPQYISLNEHNAERATDGVYQDPNGLAIIVKPDAP